MKKLICPICHFLLALFLTIPELRLIKTDLPIHKISDQVSAFIFVSGFEIFSFLVNWIFVGILFDIAWLLYTKKWKGTKSRFDRIDYLGCIFLGLFSTSAFMWMCYATDQNRLFPLQWLFISLFILVIRAMMGWINKEAEDKAVA